jgi:Zn finger protein HypA/HybF involved in hydrogenase expression
VSKEQAERMKETIDELPNAEKLFNCKKCNKKITSHNKDWHDYMCDECFNKTYFKK